MFKKIIILSLLINLTNCGAPGTALLGPSITVARTGNIYQAGLSYGSSHIIKKTRETLIQVKKAKTVVYKRVNHLHKKIKKSELNTVSLKNQREIFFKAVKDNLKIYN